MTSILICPAIKIGAAPNTPLGFIRDQLTQEINLIPSLYPSRETVPIPDKKVINECVFPPGGKGLMRAHAHDTKQPACAFLLICTRAQMAHLRFCLGEGSVVCHVCMKYACEVITSRLPCIRTWPLGPDLSYLCPSSRATRITGPKPAQLLLP